MGIKNARAILTVISITRKSLKFISNLVQGDDLLYEILFQSFFSGGIKTHIKEYKIIEKI